MKEFNITILDSEDNRDSIVQRDSCTINKFIYSDSQMLLLRVCVLFHNILPTTEQGKGLLLFLFSYFISRLGL